MKYNERKKKKKKNENRRIEWRQAAKSEAQKKSKPNVCQYNNFML